MGAIKSAIGDAVLTFIFNPTGTASFYAAGFGGDNLFSMALRFPAQAAGAVGGAWPFWRGPRNSLVQNWLLAVVTVTLVVSGSKYTGPSMNPANEPAQSLKATAAANGQIRYRSPSSAELLETGASSATTSSSAAVASSPTHSDHLLHQLPPEKMKRPVPRHESLFDKIHSRSPAAVLDEYEFNNRKMSPNLKDANRYAVIFDAGSSGSRVHVYCFDRNMDLVPIGKDLELFLQATAGLRALGGEASERILDAVRDLLKDKSTLKSEADGVTVLDGSQEGSYEWVTINYLLGKLSGSYSETVGVDLGGGSVQMAYAISKMDAEKAPRVSDGEDSYIKEMRLMDTDYYLYVHSYLHYGLLAARSEILKVSEGSDNACILAGYDEYKASAASSGSSYEGCRSFALKALKAGFIDPALPVAKVHPVDFEEAAKRACETKLEDAKSAYQRVEVDNLPYLCMDLVYQYTLLVDGFALEPWQEITLVKQIKYQDSLVEAAWPLASTRLISSHKRPTHIAISTVETTVTWPFDSKFSVAFSSFSSSDLEIPIAHKISISRGECSSDSDLSDSNDDDDITQLNLRDAGFVKDVMTIVNILNQLGDNRVEMKNKIEQCGVKVSQELVLEVLSRVRNDWEAAFTFFLWLVSSQVMSMLLNLMWVEEFQSLLSALCRYKNVQDAEHLIFSQKDVFPFNTKSFNIVLNGWCNVIGSPRQSDRIWREMCRRGIRYDAVSYASIITCYQRQEAINLMKTIEDKGIAPNTVTYNSLIKPLCKARKVDEARGVFDEMLQRGHTPTIQTYHAFFRVLRTGEEVFALLEKMRKMGCQPITDTYVMLIRKFCRWRQFDDVFKLWNEMSENGIGPDRSSYIVLIHGLFLNGKLEAAYKYYTDMKQKQLLPEPKIDEMLRTCYRINK
ncbi:hypothetical protein GH714_021976 [Hevea brasiliensis]|uniref:Apyrase n=1 Tax=Hevea brasiliensis TaxID=3981 RepID=A0A6A6M3I9_HEVBR|nr:hypothetical protein GH714_021976 [Hevea brasiliensis]